jgi:adenylate cyclase
MKVFKVCLSTLLIGIFGAVLCMTDSGIYLEEEIGLSWLFNLRGPLKPPEQVVIISIDKTSAEILHLPEETENWPRTYYSQLINKVNQQNPALIAFNLHFGETRDSEHDAKLASAMASLRNIILSTYLKRSSIPSIDRQQQFTSERIIDPIPILDHAALGTAPFPLTKTLSTIKQFWTYSAGDIATFPVATFQCFVFKKVYPEIIELLRQSNPKLVAHLPKSFEQLAHDANVLETLHKIKTKITNNDQVIGQLEKSLLTANYSPEKTRLVQSWLTFLKNGESPYLNHYGGTETLTTIPFYQAIVMEILDPDLFKNKIVMVGYSENIQPEKNQCLYTVFSTTNSECISPIELAATAVGNLIDNSWLKPLPKSEQLILLLAWGLTMCLLCRIFSYKLSLVLISLLSFGYLAIAYYEFSRHYIWIPVFIPIIVQPLLIFFTSSISQYAKNKEEKRKAEVTFGKFIPPEILALTSRADDNSLLDIGEQMQGVCMATDAGQYTSLSEKLSPLQLTLLMNKYFGVMFPLVSKHKGRVTDVIGDAMLAVWAKPKLDVQAKIDACEAALEIKSEVDGFNQSQQHQLPTRIGLHHGEMRLTVMGTRERLEYRAIGDTINTATRIEGLNKVLGTKILVSASVLENISGFSTREMGVFLLRNKKNPIKIFELIKPVDPDWPQLVFEFSKALKLFQSYQWSTALESFLELRKTYPTDGPTRYYINYLQQNMQEIDDPIYPAVIELS